MHHPTDRIAHTTAFVTPVVEHWLEREIGQWVHSLKDRSDDPSHHERTLLPPIKALPFCLLYTSSLKTMIPARMTRPVVGAYTHLAHTIMEKPVSNVGVAGFVTILPVCRIGAVMKINRGYYICVHDRRCLRHGCHISQARASEI